MEYAMRQEQETIDFIKAKSEKWQKITNHLNQNQITTHLMCFLIKILNKIKLQNMMIL